jgi:hypothetical protein
VTAVCMSVAAARWAARGTPSSLRVGRAYQPQTAPCSDGSPQDVLDVVRVGDQVRAPDEIGDQRGDRVSAPVGDRRAEDEVGRDSGRHAGAAGAPAAGTLRLDGSDLGNGAESGLVPGVADSAGQDSA